MRQWEGNSVVKVTYQKNQDLIFLGIPRHFYTHARPPAAEGYCMRSMLYIREGSDMRVEVKGYKSYKR